MLFEDLDRESDHLLKYEADVQCSFYTKKKKKKKQKNRQKQKQNKGKNQQYNGLARARSAYISLFTSLSLSLLYLGLFHRPWKDEAFIADFITTRVLLGNYSLLDLSHLLASVSQAVHYTQASTLH